MKNNQRGFATFIVIAVIAVLAVGGGVFLATKDGARDVSPSDGSVDSTSVDIATGPGAKEFGGSGEGVKVETAINGVKPEDFFRKIRAEFDATKNFAELEVFNLKYASQKYSTEIIKARAAYGTLSPAVLENLFNVAKNNLPSSAEIGAITSTATDKNVTLKISTSKNNLQGTVVLVLENGQWKVDSEVWAKVN
ncbi:MAG: hypothetical protein AAB726_02620 [Patescibacteria group bacterium]